MAVRAGVRADDEFRHQISRSGATERQNPEAGSRPPPRFGLIRAFFEVPFTYYMIRQVVADLRARTHGSVFDTITRDTFKAIQATRPGDSIAARFDEVVRSLLERVRCNLLESRTLAQLRDTLLPKLMSGEIRVRDVERVLDDTVAGEVVDFPKPTTVTAKTKRKAPDPFREAVLVAALVRGWSDADHPLGNFRLQKGAYFVHRKAEHETQTRFRKHAAGPYSPDLKYRGGIGIAERRDYVRRHVSGKYKGLIAGDAIADIDQYLPRYDFEDALSWVLDRFHFKTNDDMELLSTTDYAAQALRGEGREVDVNSVTAYIDLQPAWKPKLGKKTFSPTNIQRALDELSRLFPDEKGTV